MADITNVKLVEIQLRRSQNKMRAQLNFRDMRAYRTHYFQCGITRFKEFVSLLPDESRHDQALALLGIAPASPQAWGDYVLLIKGHRFHIGNKSYGACQHLLRLLTEPSVSTTKFHAALAENKCATLPNRFA